MKPRIYIDGCEGTTGLGIHDRLAFRDDIDVLLIDSHRRKDIKARAELINAADIVFLCLPDDAAREAVTLVENPHTRVIDASTAHRTRWTYGFPELCPTQRSLIKSSRFVSNPGCHAISFISAVYPLIVAGVLPRDYPLTCFSLTGYSGGGKKMIKDYEKKKTTQVAPCIYGLDQLHKHLPEMMSVTGLVRYPIFCPIVGDYYSGMATCVMIHGDIVKLSVKDVFELIRSYYDLDQFVTVLDFDENSALLYSDWGVGTNKLEISVCGQSDRICVVVRSDNLGKGSSGSAVQNMNIMLGMPENRALL